jgi:hypothetical protein
VDEHDILSQISRLVDEEHGLQQSHAGKPLTTEEQDSLRSIHVARDRYWDLLRQFRACRDAGQDADRAALRPDKVVAAYRQ